MRGKPAGSSIALLEIDRGMKRYHNACSRKKVVQAMVTKLQRITAGSFAVKTNTRGLCYNILKTGGREQAFPGP
jgi:hypothetical protein